MAKAKSQTRIENELRAEILKLREQLRSQHRANQKLRRKLTSRVLRLPKGASEELISGPSTSRSKQQAYKRRLIAIRKHLGITHDEFARLLGIDPWYSRHLIVKNGDNRLFVRRCLVILAERLLDDHKQEMAKQAAALKRKHKKWLSAADAKKPEQVPLEEQLKEMGLADKFMDMDIRRKILKLHIRENLDADTIAQRLVLRPELVQWHLDGVE